ncbi:MAG: hypothetical protein ACYTG0_20090 [Planctomycetota bacterium]
MPESYTFKFPINRVLRRMDDPQDRKHWDALASELGAEPPPEEERLTAVEPEQNEPGSEAVDASFGSVPATAAPKTPPPPADWYRLAEELGVELPPEPPKMEVSRPEASPQSELVEIAPEMSDLPESELAEASSNSASVDFDREWSDPAGSYVDESEALEDERLSDEREEKKAGRRRGKRRRKVPKSRDDESDEDLTEPGDADADEPEQTAASSSVAAEDTPSADSASLEEESPRRSKRRRPRRAASRTKSADDEEKGPAEPAARRRASESGEEPGGPARGRDSDDSSHEEAEPPKRKREKSAKVGHRGIPSWVDAVGIIITSNMESRSKSPNGGSSSRSRGGRSRSGRDKPREKSK